MIEPGTFLTFFLSALVLAALPGPGMLYVLARSLGGGRVAGYQSSYGTFVGGMVHVLAAAVGLSALVLASSVAFSILKWAGAAYLIYLGVRTLFSKERLALDLEGAGGPQVFTQGILTEILNPKTALFFLAFIPQFVNPQTGGVFGQFLLLGTTSVLLNTLIDLIVAHFAGPLGSRLRLSARFQRGQKLASGGALIGLGVYAVVDR